MPFLLRLQTAQATQAAKDAANAAAGTTAQKGREAKNAAGDSASAAYNKVWSFCLSSGRQLNLSLLRKKLWKKTLFPVCELYCQGLTGGSYANCIDRHSVRS